MIDVISKMATIMSSRIYRQDIIMAAN